MYLFEIQHYKSIFLSGLHKYILFYAHEIHDMWNNQDLHQHELLQSTFSPSRFTTEVSFSLFLKSWWKRFNCCCNTCFSCLKVFRSCSSCAIAAGVMMVALLIICCGTCPEMVEGTDIWTTLLACSGTCCGVTYTMRALLAWKLSGVSSWLLPKLLLRAFARLVLPARADSWEHGRLREDVLVWAGTTTGELTITFAFNSPEAAATVPVTFFISLGRCWGEFDAVGCWDCLLPVRAAGKLGFTGTEAAKVDARDKSQHTDPADLSEPLPGTRTRERTKSPVLWGATILTGDEQDGPNLAGIVMCRVCGLWTYKTN